MIFPTPKYDETSHSCHRLHLSIWRQRAYCLTLCNSALWPATYYPWGWDQTCRWVVLKKGTYILFVKYEVLDEGDLQQISIWRRVQWLEWFLTWEVPGWNLIHKTNYPQLFRVLSNLIKMLSRKITPSDWPRLLANTTFLIHHSYHFDTEKKVVAAC